jgi:hypothetical protein
MLISPKFKFKNLCLSHIARDILISLQCTLVGLLEHEKKSYVVFLYPIKNDFLAAEITVLCVFISIRCRNVLYVRCCMCVVRWQFPPDPTRVSAGIRIRVRTGVHVCAGIAGILFFESIHTLEDDIKKPINFLAE